VHRNLGESIIYLKKLTNNIKLTDIINPTSRDIKTIAEIIEAVRELEVPVLMGDKVEA
jgi:hypothetical protein